MVTESEVQADDIHAGVEHLLHGDCVVAARTQRPYYRCLPLVQIDLLEDVLEANT